MLGDQTYRASIFIMGHLFGTRHSEFVVASRIE
jgi:hypothetical protein